MGKPVNINKFVKEIINSYDYLDNFNQKIKINYIGLRKGEKLHEELYYPKYSIKLKNEMIYLETRPTRKTISDLKKLMIEIKKNNFKNNTIKNKLFSFVN